MRRMLRTVGSVVGHRLGLLAIILVCQLAHIIGSLWMIGCLIVNSDRYWRIARGYDRMGNAVAGGLDTETVSSRANRKRREGVMWGCVLCRVLDWLDPDHCEKSAEDAR